MVQKENDSNKIREKKNKHILRDRWALHFNGMLNYFEYLTWVNRIGNILGAIKFFL
jgi:hypothetical protein